VRQVGYFQEFVTFRNP